NGANAKTGHFKVMANPDREFQIARSFYPETQIVKKYMQDHNLFERSWYLAAKKLTSGLNAAEQEEWEAILNETPEFYGEFQRVAAYWEKAGDLPHQKIDTEKDWKTVWQKIRQEAGAEQDTPFLKPSSERTERKQTSRGVWLKYAAAVSIFLISGFLIWWIFGNVSNLSGQARLTTI